MLPDIERTPRVDRDIARCLRFISCQPWRKPADRERDIYRGIARIRRGPLLNDVGARRRRLGLELRRHNAAQFAIIYAYTAPNGKFPRGMVSIRAVRHERVNDVFKGVREPHLLPYCASADRYRPVCFEPLMTQDGLQ